MEGWGWGGGTRGDSRDFFDDHFFESILEFSFAVFDANLVSVRIPNWLPFFFSWFNFASFCFEFVQVVFMLIQVDSKWLQVVFNLHQIENNFGLNVMYMFMYKYLLINV